MNIYIYTYIYSIAVFDVISAEMNPLGLFFAFSLPSPPILLLPLGYTPDGKQGKAGRRHPKNGPFDDENPASVRDVQRYRSH